MKLGIDVSTLIEERKAEAQYFINDKLVETLQVFAENNGELVRLRLWVDHIKNKNKNYLGGTSVLEPFNEIDIAD